MKITYTGKQEALTPAENSKIEQRFVKLSKLLDSQRGEAEAHVILSAQRHLQRAEITVKYRDHQLFCASDAADAFTAISETADKLEKQILKLREKSRDTKRGPKQEPDAEAVTEAAPQPGAKPTKGGGPRVESDTESGPQVHRVNHHDRRKPMTVEEAMIEIDARDYVVYRDAETNRISVLIRRRDGDFDLIEA